MKTPGSEQLCWTQNADSYLAASVVQVKERLLKEGVKKLPWTSTGTPLQALYSPWNDVSPELKITGHRYFQELIGILRWGVELGRLDILLEVSLLSQYLASPREGHLQPVLYIFGYLEKNPKKKIAFDHHKARVEEANFNEYDWYDFYKGVKEGIPSNMPEPRGKSVHSHCYVDADLAADTKIRRSQTGIIIFVMCAPILWHSKLQYIVEASTYGSEIVAMENAVELIEGLRYKLRMFRIPLEGPTDVHCDDEAVVLNCSTPESTLKKKHHSIGYHQNREAVAAGTIRIAKVHTDWNLADLFTKMLNHKRRTLLIECFMF